MDNLIDSGGETNDSQAYKALKVTIIIVLLFLTRAESSLRSGV